MSNPAVIDCPKCGCLSFLVGIGDNEDRILLCSECLARLEEGHIDKRLNEIIFGDKVDAAT